MAEPTEALRGILERHAAAPFLFVGSGFSRRYLGLEDWSGLLRRFCKPIRDFGYYSAKASGDLPQAASFMAMDYNEWWWSDANPRENREAVASLIKNQADALKIDIASYMSELSLEKARSGENGGELALFSEISVDGIITTNWDLLLEDLFPDFKVFIGQQELLFSHPQSIGEIYKIHGSATNPSSLVLTAEDYIAFAERNPYLAAKLVTIFVEHPIIFLGYSIADPHIRNVITSIARCLTQDKITAFQENLIFVQRIKSGESPAIEKTTIQSDNFSVTMMVAKVQDYSDIYQALTGSKRKIPARVLRFFKEQLFELVHNSADTDKKIAVVDFEEIDSAENVEFVVGVGVARDKERAAQKAETIASDRLSAKGYEGVSADELFEDCLAATSKFSAADLMKSAFPGYARSNRTFIPIFRYLKDVGISDSKELAESNLEGAKKIVGKLHSATYNLPSYKNRYEDSFQGMTTSQIISKASSPAEAVLMISFQEDGDIDLGTLRNFLLSNLGKVTTQPYASQFSKLVCRYDKLAYGF